MAWLNDAVAASGIVLLLIVLIMFIGMIWSERSFKKQDRENEYNICKADHEIREKMGEELARHYF